MRALLQIFLGSMLAMQAACATANKEVKRKGVTTVAQAREEYLAGLRALKEADYVSAREHLEKVAVGPAYIVYTPLAKLRLADALMFEEKYEEAAEAYREFTATTVADPNLHYAYFKLAEALVRSIPAEFFLRPPNDRKDQRPVREAIKALSEFLNGFPNSPFVLEGREMLERAIRIVTSYEMEVARFYLTRDKPLGAVRRMDRLLKDFPQAGQFQEVHGTLIEALAQAGDKERLAKECASYKQRFPQGRRKILSLCTDIVAHGHLSDNNASGSEAPGAMPNTGR